MLDYLSPVMLGDDGQVGPPPSPTPTPTPTPTPSPTPTRPTKP